MKINKIIPSVALCAMVMAFSPEVRAMDFDTDEVTSNIRQAHPNTDRGGNFTSGIEASLDEEGWYSAVQPYAQFMYDDVSRLSKKVMRLPGDLLQLASENPGMALYMGSAMVIQGVSAVYWKNCSQQNTNASVPCYSLNNCEMGDTYPSDRAVISSCPTMYQPNCHRFYEQYTCQECNLCGTK